MLGKNLFDRLDTGLDGRLIAGCAVLSQQIFQHVGGNDGVALDRLDEILADNESREVCVDFLVKSFIVSPVL
jgi:hypothetical protein